MCNLAKMVLQDEPKLKELREKDYMEYLFELQKRMIKRKEFLGL